MLPGVRERSPRRYLREVELVALTGRVEVVGVKLRRGVVGEEHVVAVRDSRKRAAAFENTCELIR